MLSDPDKLMLAMLKELPASKVVNIDWREQQITVRVDKTRNAIHSFNSKPAYQLIEAIRARI